MVTVNMNQQTGSPARLNHGEVNMEQVVHSSSQPKQDHLPPTYSCPFSHGDQDPPINLDDFWDAPINWDAVDKVSKPSLMKEIQRRFCCRIKPDLFVEVGNKVFGCHLAVLKYSSTFFKDCKYGETIKLSNLITPAMFDALYNWMTQVTDKVEDLLTRRNILDVLTAVQYLGIPQIENQCWAFIGNQAAFSEETAVYLFVKAQKRNLDVIMDLMLPRISECFLSLVSQEYFDQLNLCVVKKLFNSNYIALHNEVELFYSAIKWLMYDWAIRQDSIVQLMSTVRFGLMDPVHLVDIRNRPLNSIAKFVAANREVKKMIDEGMEVAVLRHHCQTDTQSQQFQVTLEQLHLKDPPLRRLIISGKAKRYHTFDEFLEDLKEYRVQYRKTADM